MRISKQIFNFVCFLLPFTSWGQGVYWKGNFPNQYINPPKVAAAKDNSGYMIVGNSVNSGRLTRLNPDGQILFTQNPEMRFEQILATRDSSWIFCGYPFGSGSVLRKVDRRGNLVWQTALSPSGATGHLIETANQDLILYGKSADSMWIRRFSPRGQLRWERRWHEPSISEMGRLTETSQGQFVFHHGAWGVPTDSMYSLHCLDSLGNRLWRHRMPNEILSCTEQNSEIVITTNSLRMIFYHSNGNIIRNISNTNTFRGFITKRRQGGFWYYYLAWNAARGLYERRLSQLDNQANPISDYLLPIYYESPNKITEISDSTLLFEQVINSGTGTGSNGIFLMVTDHEGRIHKNLIRGNLQSACSNRFQGWLVGATRRSDGATYYGVSDINNRFEIAADTGIYTVRAYPQTEHWGSTPITISSLVSEQIDSISLNINCLANCPALKVDITTPILRRCFLNDYLVRYENQGTRAATNAYIEIQLDTVLTYLTSTIPLTSRVGQRLRFHLGTVLENSPNQFRITTRASCGDTTRLGQAVCVEARIFPDTTCLTKPNWIGANLRVQGSCQQDSVQFTVQNIGRASSSSLTLLVTENAQRILKTTITLGSQAQTVYKFPSNGNTWRLHVEQEPNHPFDNAPMALVEGCRSSISSNFATGFSNQFGLDIRNPVQKVFCMELTGAYDPNDKMSFPQGYGANRLIEPNETIEYMIRFQNTGTDTAFTVVLKDTLSEWLDVSSIQVLGSSHLYDWKVLKNNILQFNFFNIRLVDSFRNEPLSHGFVKFQIRQKPNVALGTKIYNRAGIYFDYNDAVLTNRTMLTVGKNFIVSGLLDVGSRRQMRLFTYPNPTTHHATLELLDAPDDDAFKNFVLMDASGREVYRSGFRGNRYDWAAGDLSSGIYFFRVEQQGQIIGTGRIVIQAR